MNNAPVLPINPDFPVLYSFRRCPYAMRARLAIALSGVKVELREVVLRDKPPSLLSFSPKGTVPVLVLSDGQVIDQSLDVLLWALGQHDPDGWMDIDTTELNRLVEWNDGDFKRNLDGYKYPERYPDSDKTAEECRSDAESWLVELNSRLSNTENLLSDRPTAADIAIMPFMRQFANTDPEWFASSPYPDLRRWLSSWIESTLFIGIMKKYPQWHAGEAPTFFPERIS